LSVPACSVGSIFDKWPQTLAFIYKLAHFLGQLLVGLIRPALAPNEIPQQLVDPIGFLALLTLFLALAEVARRLAWIIVLVGWILIVTRVLTWAWPIGPR
jgi:hypothetical protein